MPTKVLAVFVDPLNGKIKVLVHPCQTRRLEDLVHSSAVLEHWSLQYKPRLELKQRVYDSDFDQWDSLFSIVGIDQCVDTIHVVQEFPGVLETISYSSELSDACGVKLTSDNPIPYQLNGKKRFAMHAARSVMVFRPFLEWGNVLWDEINDNHCDPDSLSSGLTYDSDNSI